MIANILVIEDDSALVELIEYNLTAAGYRVVTADSVEKGRILLLQTAFDLLIVDWMLPGLSGIEFCAQLRCSEHFRHVKILMLTARGQEVDRIRGLSAGADDYLVKPFSVSEFLDHVGSLLPGGSCKASN